MFRQYALISGNTRTVAWIDREPPLRRGTQLTLRDRRDASRVWTVEHAGTLTLETAPDVSWQVGGIVGRMRQT